MTLHCEAHGQGPDVVLLHGWGWHGGVWDGCAQQLARRFRVWIVDLPGHGRSRDAAGDVTLDELTAAVAACVPQVAVWIGWSLGGLIALVAATRGHARKLVLTGTTPRFVQDRGWSCGLAHQWFADFSVALARDASGTLERFASLHLAGVGSERNLLRALRAEQRRYPLPELNALCSGLRLLAETDLRAQLAAIATPTLVWHGARDQIAAPAAGAYLAHTLPQARLVRVADAGHAPFLSHPNEFVSAVEEWLCE